MSVPHSLRNHARLTLVEVKCVFLPSLELRPKEDVNGTLEQIEEFVLLRVHLPLVTYPRRSHRQDAHQAAVELHRDELNRRNGASGQRCS